MKTTAGQERRAGLERRVAEHVLEELLADEHRAHQRAEHDDPRAGRDPEDPAAGDVQVVERIARRGAGGGRRRSARRRRSRPAPAPASPCSGTGAKLIARISAPTSTTDRIAAEVVDRLGRLVDVGRDEARRPSANATTTSGSVIEEDRAPAEVLEQGAGDQRAERRDRAAERRPQRDRLRPARARPQRGDQRQRRRVGHARRDPAEDPRDEQHRRRAARTPRADTRGPTAPCRARASACARSGRRARRGRAPSRPARASSRPRSGSSVLRGVERLADVGSATFATDRFRLATPATRIRPTRTMPACSGAPALPPARESGPLTRSISSHRRPSTDCA